MQLRVGSYTLEGFVPSYNREVVRSDRGYAQRLRITIGVQGDLFAATTVEMSSRIQELFDNVDGDYRDVVIVDDDGNDTPLALINSSSIDGVRMITPVNFPDLNTIYGLKVPFEAEWQADYSLSDDTNGGGEPAIMEFTETLSWQGDGGPLKTIILTPKGAPIEITTAERTPYFATQSGSIKTRGPVTRIPKPIWPDKLIGPNNAPTQSSPIIRSGAIESYSASWSYSFQSIEPLIGKPTEIL